MGIDDRKLDQIRSEQSELENHYIDELVAGRLDRRSFLRRGAVLGMSASVMGAVLAACGGANNSGGGGSGASATQAGSSTTPPPATGTPTTPTTPTQPSRTASSASSVRLSTPYLPNSRRRWLSTVLTSASLAL